MTGWEPGALFCTFKRPCNCIWHSRLPDDENYSTSKSFYMEHQRCHEKWTRRRTLLVGLGIPHLSSVIAMVWRASFSHLHLGRAAGFLDPIPERQGNLRTLLFCIPVVLARLAHCGLHLLLVSAGPAGGGEPTAGGCSSSPSGRELAWGSKSPEFSLC